VVEQAGWFDACQKKKKKKKIVALRFASVMLLMHAGDRT